MGDTRIASAAAMNRDYSIQAILNEAIEEQRANEAPRKSDGELVSQWKAWVSTVGKAYEEEL